MGNKEPTRPETVPAEAEWNASENEWELGEKKDGKMVGEWKWWLAPNGHLVCRTSFDDNGTMLAFKRFHPNGEVSREGELTAKGKWKKDIYFASSEPTSEIFAYGPVDNAWKAVKRVGEIPVSFDYYDKDGKHLNPVLEPAKLSAPEPSSSMKDVVKQIRELGGRSAAAGEIDEEPLDITQSFESSDIIHAMMDGADDLDADTIFFKGDLHIPRLETDGPISVLVVDGNLTVDACLATYDDPVGVVVVSGNLTAGSVVVSGGLFVKGDVKVAESLIGDYNHGYAEIDGSLSSNLFYPEEFFFTVNGDIDLKFAFGNEWRLNENQNADAFNANEKTVRDFFDRLHPDVMGQIDISDDTYLDDPLADGTLWEYLDRYSFMSYVRSGAPLFT